MKPHFWYKRTNFTQKVSAVQAFNFFFPPPESNYFELVLSLQQCDAPRCPCPAPCLQQHLVPNVPSAVPQDGRCDSGDVFGAGSQSGQKMKTATVTQNTSSTMAITWSKIVGFYFFLNQKLRPSPWRKTILHMHHSYTAVAFPPHYLWPPPLFFLSFPFFIVYYLHCKYLMAALLSSLCKNPGLFLGI